MTDLTHVPLHEFSGEIRKRYYASHLRGPAVDAVMAINELIVSDPVPVVLTDRTAIGLSNATIGDVSDEIVRRYGYRPGAVGAVSAIRRLIEAERNLLSSG